MSSRPEPSRRRSFFTRLAQGVARWAGKPVSFVSAVAIVALWAASGPFLGFSEAWQLTINSTTTIITFLMVFIIQNSQNRDIAAMQIKLDELLTRTRGAREELIDMEELDEDKIEEIRQDFERRARKARMDRDPDGAVA